MRRLYTGYKNSIVLISFRFLLLQSHLMGNNRNIPLSTSALARQLGLPSQALFSLLDRLGWIKRAQDTWVLTPKGEFEGGSYHDSDRYGRYVVWPDTIMQHAGLQKACSGIVISASSIGRDRRVSGRYMNHVFHELGWIVPGIKGWRITDAGKALGGVEIENEETSVPYVKWPPDLLRNPRLQAALENSYGEVADNIAAAEPGQDLFTQQQRASCSGIDGHGFEQLEMAAICNWLYFAGLTHSCGRSIPGDTEHRADFYLPGGNIYIEYWGEQGDGAFLTEKLDKKEALQAQGLAVVELGRGDIEHLDEVLNRELFRHGVTVY